MTLWWLQPGWTETRCANCGSKIWPEGDPDWGLCFQCFTEQMQQQQQFEQEQFPEEPLPIRSGGPAFPVPEYQSDVELHGMTLRDWFAGQALAAALIIVEGEIETAENIASRAYEIADAMIAERNKP